MLASVHSGCVLGIEARPVTVEVHLGKGLPGFDIVGLPEAAVREARVRVRAAIATSGLELPQRHLVLNLAPSDLRKSGSALDLAIAIAALAASGLCSTARLEDTLLVGELSLGGDVRPVRGVLAHVRAAVARGLARAIVPAGNAEECGLVTGIEMRVARTLRDVLAFLSHETELPRVLGRGPAAAAASGGASEKLREDLADEWTRRQVAAIKSADPGALVTVGLIQWSVPVLLPAGPRHYSAFRPERQAKFLDFLEVHFYPLDHGAYEYRDAESEARNLAYLESVVREVARPGKPVVIAEFGWYGGGQPTFDQGKHPAATEEQQAQWCRRLVETTRGLAVGWLNWGFYDQPEASDCSQLTGLLTADGKSKAWGREFQKLAGTLASKRLAPAKLTPRPALDWERCVTSSQAGNQFREQYYQAFKAEPQR